MAGTWVIFEGPDGAGKSTMADKAARMLADDAGPTVLQHLTSHSKFDEYYGPARMWKGSGLNVVQDRCAISDLTYAPVLSGVASRFGEQRVRDQLRKVADHSFVVHVTASEETLQRRINERGDALIQGPMLHAILKNYWREVGWWRDQGAYVLEFDTTDDAFPSDDELLMALSVGAARLLP